MDYVFHRLHWSAEGTIDAKALQQFLLNEQKTTKTEKECLALVNKYGSSSSSSSNNNNNSSSAEPSLTRFQFTLLFTGEKELFSLFNPAHYSVCQPMDQPMTHYFIASSHNTYLTGNQLTSRSSVDMYRSVLLEGCRCVEIDIWHRSNMPVVTHGHTLTTQISLLDVLTTINEFAFARSPFPLVLSIENHLEMDQQKTMAQMLKKVLADKLFTGAISPSETTFPSPEQFKWKIFIKGKKIPDEYFEDGGDDDLPPSYDELFVIPKADPNAESFKRPQFLPKSQIRFRAQSGGISVDQSTRHTSYTYSHLETSDFSEREQYFDALPTEVPVQPVSFFRSVPPRNLPDFEPTDKPQPQQTKLRSDSQKETKASLDLKKPKTIKISAKSKLLDQEFSDMVTYFQARKFTHFSECKTFKFYEMISHSEGGSAKVIRSSRHAYRRFTSTNMVRVYPNGLRVDSSNYCPLKHWAAGAQLVALNYQTLGLTEKYTPMLLNQALFRLNGGCGYVLKPRYLRTLEKHSNLNHLRWQHLKIRIISAELNRTVFENSTNFYVTVKFFTPHRHVEKWSTGRVQNSLQPFWNRSLELSNIKYAEISFVQIMLKSNRGLLGLYTISVEAMQEGYRRITLINEDFKEIEATSILVHVKRSASSDRHLKLPSTSISLGCFSLN